MLSETLSSIRLPRSIPCWPRIAAKDVSPACATDVFHTFQFLTTRRTALACVIGRFRFVIEVSMRLFVGRNVGIPREQRSALFNVPIAMPGAPAAEATTFCEAGRKNMQAPAANEFLPGQSHFFRLSAAPVSRTCASGERDASTIIRNQSTV